VAEVEGNALFHDTANKLKSATAAKRKNGRTKRGCCHGEEALLDGPRR
jgi:hypothetical protein